MDPIFFNVYVPSFPGCQNQNQITPTIGKIDNDIRRIFHFRYCPCILIVQKNMVFFGNCHDFVESAYF